jgi:hypothetical protein
MLSSYLITKRFPTKILYALEPPDFQPELRSLTQPPPFSICVPGKASGNAEDKNLISELSLDLFIHVKAKNYRLIRIKLSEAALHFGSSKRGQ